MLMTNLRKIREAKGLSLEEAAHGIGISVPYLQKLEVGTRDLKMKWIRKMSDFYRIRPNDIIEPSTNPVSFLEGKAQSAVEAPFSMDKIPILGIANGSGEAIMLSAESKIGYVERHPKQHGMHGAFAVYARGDSMYPRYKEGEILYAIQDRKPVKGQDCIIEMLNGEAFVKEFDKCTEKEIICRQHNPSSVWKRSLDEVKAIHLVVGQGLF